MSEQQSITVDFEIGSIKGSINFTIENSLNGKIPESTMHKILSQIHGIHIRIIEIATFYKYAENNSNLSGWQGDFLQLREDLGIALKNLTFGKQLAEKLGLAESNEPIYLAFCNAIESTNQAIKIYDGSSQN